MLTDAEVRRIYGQRIAAARTALDLTQRELGAALAERGCATTPQSISDWELGNTAPGTVRRIALVAVLGAPDLFHVDLDGDEAVA